MQVSKQVIFLLVTIYIATIFIEETLPKLNFTDALDLTEAIHNYSVTAVYADGAESTPITLEVASGIDTINRNETIAYDVYSIEGILVCKKSENLRHLQPGIYIVNGRKCILK